MKNRPHLTPSFVRGWADAYMSIRREAKKKESVLLTQEGKIKHEKTKTPYEQPCLPIRQ